MTSLRCVTGMEARLHIFLICVLRRRGWPRPHPGQLHVRGRASDTQFTSAWVGLRASWDVVETRIEARFLECHPVSAALPCVATWRSYDYVQQKRFLSCVKSDVCVCVCPAVDFSLSAFLRQGKHLARSEQSANGHSQNYLKSPNPKEEFALFFKLNNYKIEISLRRKIFIKWLKIN